MHPDVLTVFFEHALTSGFGHIALLTERGVSKHFADRHSGRFQATEKLDPDQHSYIVVPPPRTVPVGIGKQSDPLIIPQGMGRQTTPLCEIANLHGNLFSLRRRHSYPFEHTLSQGEYDVGPES